MNAVSKWRYAVGQRHLIRADADDEELAVLTLRLAPSLGFYAWMREHDDGGAPTRYAVPTMTRRLRS